MYSVRKNCGRILAEEAPVEADIVSTIPESATPAALGFSEATGIPYSEVTVYISVGVTISSDICDTSDWGACRCSVRTDTWADRSSSPPPV